MLDVIAHFATLDVLRARLDAEVISGAATDGRLVDAQKALQSHYPYALLGAVIDHLLAHDGPSDREVALLQQALVIWNTVRAFQLDFRATRAKIEAIAMNPTAPTALADYNAARQSMADLIDRHDQIIASLQAFRWALFPLSHLTPHPRQDDQPVKNWPWRDVILSRRTGAFAAEVMHQARDIRTPEALAFAVGVLSSYIGNTLGSPYLVHGVGGPRRSHPYRDRLASYAVGAWLREVPLPLHFSFDRVRWLPVIGSPQAPALPPWLREMIRKALQVTYGAQGPAALPQIPAAYAQFVEHWRLLNSFTPLPPAAPIATALRVQMNTQLTPADYDRPDPPPQPGSTGPAPSGGGGNIFDPGPGQPPWFRPAHNDVTDWIAEICEDILLLPFFLIRVGFWLGHKAGDKKPTNTGSSRSALSAPLAPADYTATTGGKDILIAIDELFYLDNAIQRLVTDCLRLLEYLGLLYAEPKELHNPEFLECLVLPPATLSFSWPAEPIANPNAYLDLPSSPLEKPAEAPSGFAPGEKPIAFLIKTLGGGATVFDAGFDMLTQELLESPTSPFRVTNLDLDGDRGVGQECWEIKPGTSIHDNPVQPVVLGYNAV